MTKISRRENLLARMQELESQGQSCIGCAGNCCTYEGNSMMITPWEAAELKLYLESQGAFTPELKSRLQGTVTKFRLDAFTGNGRRSFIRRSYTCPLFNHKELGCPLPREVKPYGCLAFNSHHEQMKASELCYSEKSLLEARENEYLEWELSVNEKLRIKFQLYWEKISLPQALLDIWDKDISDADLIPG
jgi:Fe-S-cluster containining protein